MTYQPSKSPLLKYYQTLGGNALGRWVFSKAVCTAAPYFWTIRPTFTQLAPGHTEVVFKRRWLVQNHLQTVHAIAMCNAAELVGGACLDVSLHAGLRWIPVGMNVAYLKMAKTDLRAVCKVDDFQWTTPQDVVMPVDLFDTKGQKVFHADITMRLSPKRMAA